MDIFSIAVGLMIRFSNASSFSTTTPGSYYEVSAMQYDAVKNKTYSEWSRYDVYSKYDVHGDHFHVEITDGKTSINDLVKLAQSRCDPGITAISGL